ncbi:MAG TPA: Holliday junction branch migration protein RuvA [Candidatus Latescibacteria bacterium]|nr:Holliday junction branch migration protein RuvA [Candidatus Latescibacterota bacterium]HJP29741.1 Holliday junction branch migration protein RuvA [Candidatus Latescibacterota bacterium]
MIHHLRGTLMEKTPTQAVIDVGGVGYGLSTSLNTFDTLPAVGEPVGLHTYTYVREDRIQLFAFSDPAEREMFELLIGVSGIGPKLAQTILSGLSVTDLQKAILQERVTELTQVRGVGSKTAQRVVVELKDRIRLSTALGHEEEGESPGDDDPVGQEATMALEALGIATAAARKAVTAARRKHAGDEPTVQDLIKGALRER